jgi:hypothetical protein
MIKIQKVLVLIALALVTAVFFNVVEAKQTQELSSVTAIRVGVYDSRAVAMSYYRSEQFNTPLSALFAKLGKAKEDGDKKTVEELESLGPALQELIHKQSFGDWPVSNIMKIISDELPEIAKQADVGVIISKWDITFQQPAAELVDVTHLLVNLFNPSEETLKIVDEIMKTNPVSEFSISKEYEVFAKLNFQ